MKPAPSARSGAFTRLNAAEHVAGLIETRGPLAREDIYCGFTSGEWPGDNLLMLICEGLDDLLRAGRAFTGTDGKVVLR